MPRKPRFNLPGDPLHLVQRTHHRMLCFFTDEDRRYYLKSLHDSCKRYRLDIHAYVLMPDHVHLLVTPRDKCSASRVIHTLAYKYDCYFNAIHQKSVTLWDGCFEASVVQDERYFLMCSRYIELTPVRCGIVIRPGDYVWSSYRSNALGEKNPLLTPHTTYLALGRQIARRRVSYRKLFEVDGGVNNHSEMELKLINKTTRLG